MQSESDLGLVEIKDVNAGVACLECGRWFRNQAQLKSHMWRHTGEKPYACVVCNHRFTQQGNLKAHMRIHTGEKPYHCKEPGCDAKFTQKSNLKAHTKIHTGEKPFKCGYCTSAFRQATNLRTHLAIHTGERPYECDICSKAFTQKSNLKAHRDRVHRAYKKNQTESVTLSVDQSDSFYNNLNILYTKVERNSYELPSQNEIIVETDNSMDYSMAPTVEIMIPESIMTKHEPFEFPTEKSDYDTMEIAIPGIKEEACLDIEIVEGNIDNPYSCEICYNTYLSARDLRIHQCIKGLRYFQCDLCKDSLRTLADLKNHQASHSEGKKYSCSLCGIIFTSHFKLKLHYKLHKKMIDSYACDMVTNSRELHSKVKDCYAQKQLAFHKKHIKKKSSNTVDGNNFDRINWNHRFNEKISSSKSANYSKNKAQGVSTKLCQKGGKKIKPKCNKAKSNLSHRKFRQSLSLHYAVSYKHFLMLQRKFMLRQNSRHQSGKRVSLAKKVNSEFLHRTQPSEHAKEMSKSVSKKLDSSPLFMCSECKSYFSSLGNIKAHMEIHRKKKTSKIESINKNLKSQSVFLISASSKYDEPIAQISRLE